MLATGRPYAISLGEHMSDLAERYSAKLTGGGNGESHVRTLQRNAAFHVGARRDAEKYHLTITGPDRESSVPNLATLRTECLRRAKELGVESEIGFSTSDNIWAAERAERTVLAGKLECVIWDTGTGVAGAITLAVPDVGQEKVRECIPFYAASRISVLAEALQVQVDGPVLRASN